MYGYEIQDVMLTGEVVGEKYTVGEFIGSGGFGGVFKCLDDSGNAHAVKLLHPNCFGYTARFLKEARLQKKLFDRNVTGILPVYDTGMWSCEERNIEVPYFVMKLVENPRSLDPNEDADWSYRQRVQLLIRALSYIDHLHHENWIHRDIKPSNLLVDKHARLYISDFGLAGFDEQATQNVDSTFARKTAIVGAYTPGYAPPEQALKIKECLDDRKIDVYACAVMTYCVLADGHRRPRFNQTTSEYAEAFYRGEDGPPREFVPPIGALHNEQSRNAVRLLNATLQYCLKQHPDRRAPNLDELLRSLERFQHALPDTAVDSSFFDDTHHAPSGGGHVPLGPDHSGSSRPATESDDAIRLYRREVDAAAQSECWGRQLEARVLAALKPPLWEVSPIDIESGTNQQRLIYLKGMVNPVVELWAQRSQLKVRLFSRELVGERPLQSEISTVTTGAYRLSDTSPAETASSADEYINAIQQEWPEGFEERPGWGAVGFEDVHAKRWDEDHETWYFDSQQERKEHRVTRSFERVVTFFLRNFGSKPDTYDDHDAAYFQWRLEDDEQKEVLLGRDDVQELLSLIQEGVSFVEQWDSLGMYLPNDRGLKVVVKCDNTEDLAELSFYNGPGMTEDIVGDFEGNIDGLGSFLEHLSTAARLLQQQQPAERRR